MRLPTWDELSAVEEQLEVLEYPLDRSLFVVGPPGSGKTVLAMQRAKMVAELDTRQPVAVVTYNRMLKRLLALLIDQDVSIDTMHSFVWHDFKRRAKAKVPQHMPYVYDWDAILECLAKIRAGMIKSHLVVDEGQDLPQGFFIYASQYVSQTMTVFADEDQALDNQRTTLKQIKSASGLNDPIILKLNHRNTPEIARVAEHYHTGSLPAATVIRSTITERPRLVQIGNLESTADFVSNWYQNYGVNVGVIVKNNATGSDLHGMVAERLPKEARVDIYDSESKNEESINMLTPGITVLNTQSVKGQEFDAVFIAELEGFIPCGNDAACRAMYMMCTRARDHLFFLYGPDFLSAAAEAALPGSDVLERA